MPRHALVMLALLPVVALPAAAAEFIPGWDVDGVGSSNVLRTAEDPESDFSIRTGPVLRLRNPRGDLTYDLNYQLKYEDFARLNGISSFDQYFYGKGSWRATPTTTFSLTDDFAYTSSLGGLFDTIGTGANQVAIVSPRRERITINTANANLTQRIGPLWQLSFDAGNQLYDYRNPDQTDSTATTGTIQLTRGVTPRLVVGGGARFQRQDFESVGQRPGSGTSFYQAFGVVQYSLSRTWSIVAQAGPAYAVPDQPPSVGSVNVLQYQTVDPRTCLAQSPTGAGLFRPTQQDPFGGCDPSRYSRTVNGQVQFLNPNLPAGATDVTGAQTTVVVPFVGDQSVDASLNYFGRLSIEKAWRLWRADLAYERSASNASGFGTSTSLDVLEGTLNWTPSPLWQVNFTASYSTQSSISQPRGSEVALTYFNAPAGFGNFSAPIGLPVAAGLGEKFDDAIDVSTYLLALYAQRRISRRLSVDGSVSWWQQQNKGQFFAATDVQVYRVVVGFSWHFDPIPL
jgi:hypothetical protein